MDRSRVPLLLSSRSPRVVPYSANAVNFDGTNDYLVGTQMYSTGNSKVGWFNVWVKPAATGFQILFRNNKFTASVNTGGKFGIAGSAALSLETNAVFSVGNWYHVCLSWDGDVGASSVKLYINGSKITAWSTAPTMDGTNLNLSDSAPDVGSSNGGSKYSGCMADLGFDASEYIDLDTHIGSFIAGGKPVAPGEDYTNWTGSVPQVLFTGPTVDWHQNKGTGATDPGTWTENGELTDCANGPSD